MYELVMDVSAILMVAMALCDIEDVGMCQLGVALIMKSSTWLSHSSLSWTSRGAGVLSGRVGNDVSPKAGVFTLTDDCEEQTIYLYL